MTEKALKFGLVGAGRIADSYVQAFRGLQAAHLVAVSDVESAAAEALAAKVGCAAYDSHRQMYEDHPLDAVIICTPPVTHPELAIFFLERQVHVLCEKPLSIDSGSARLMLATARRYGARLTMASKFRYVEDVMRAKSIVRSGILGEILLVENTFASRVDMADRWNSNPEVAGGGVLIDNGTHSVDIMRYLLGPLTDVQVVEGRRPSGYAVEETVQLFVRSGCGAIGSIDLSWRLQKEVDYFLNIYGVHGTVSVGWKNSKYRQATSRDWIIFGDGYDKVQAFRSQLENFCSAIRGEEALLITPADALASVEVIEAAYAALKNSHWTPVAPKAAADDADVLELEERLIA
ncbi:MAG TPA: Gfo/Idh/MocA family oxidoreductase [Blastocatellia bacterium]|nr:Gfo/Idh/MocA family oxidoreductase [Blastocatellia bacterium]